MREVDPYIRQQSVGAGVKPRRGNSNSTTVLQVFGNEGPLTGKAQCYEFFCRIPSPALSGVYSFRKK